MFQGVQKAIRLDISNSTQKSTDVSFFRKMTSWFLTLFPLIRPKPNSSPLPICQTKSTLSYISGCFPHPTF